mmetsp:Transcript_17655/g.43143  ORF Transcript_17655/g.43143 Transcript_17655/m.43143 type:complete len:274 (-) Transcript_17655:472-1293(-)
MAGQPLHLCLRLQQRGRADPQQPGGRPRPHHLRGVQRGRAPPPEPRPPRRHVHFLPHHPHQDGAALVLHPLVPAPPDGPRARGQDPGAAEREEDSARGAELDLHGHHRHDCVEHPPARHLPAPLPPGPPRRVHLPQLYPRRAPAPLCQLHPRLGPSPPALVSAPSVGCVGSCGRRLPLAAPRAAQQPQGRVPAQHLLHRAADGLRGVARVWVKQQEQAPRAPHRAPSPPLAGPQAPRAHAPRALPRHGLVGRQPLALRRDLPLRAQAAPVASS